MNLLEDRKFLLLMVLAFIAISALLTPWPKVGDLHKETDHVGMIMLICFMVFIAICSMAAWSLFDHGLLQATQAS
jgi:type VI protein secretion system component VasK